MLVLALLVVGVGGAKGVTLNASFQTPASNGSWNAGTNTYSWTGSYSNLMTIFSFSGGQLANYTSLHLTTSNYTDTYRVCFMNGSTAVATIAFYSAGQKDLVLADRTETKDLDLSTVTHISFGGNSNSGSVTLTNVYLEGPDPVYRQVKKLGSRITFTEALASSDPFVMVQNGKVFCGPLSPSDGSLTFKDVSEIDNYSWTIDFEEDADHAGSYFMQLYSANHVSKGFVNASLWSHTYLSGVDKSGSKGELQDGALWTVTDLGNGKYSIRNLGVAEGNYNNKPEEKDGDRAEKGQGYLAITLDGYWANHVTHYNTSGEWEFYALDIQNLPVNDPVYYGWDNLVVDGSADVTKDNDTHLVCDTRGYAEYWAETAKWELGSPFDASEYRYMVFYTKRNATRYGKGDENTGGSVFIRDDAGTTFRGDDYAKYNDVNYPAHTGSMWMNIWNKQRATVVDLQWLANADKYGDASECKVLDITKIKAFGFSGTFTVGGAFFTNTLPDFDSGNYKRSFTSFDKFGTICLPYSAVCCGAQLYEIVGGDANGISLAEYEGVMEAGKPYLYMSLEAKEQHWGNVNDETEVYFFKAGYRQVDAPVPNNGLIGTFTNTTAPQGSDIYVLSNNRLYDTEGSTVTIGANKAYIDMAQVPTGGGAARDIMLYFGDADETTGIADMSSQKADVKAIYNLQGQRVNRLQKGLNIVNGKKVLMK